MATKTAKFQPVANPVGAKARSERAFGGSWGTHDNRPARQRTRAMARKAAFRDFA